ncbi:hypothetical protein G9A89_020493 [Geosiphon pyriformis]|nr:hypothetical protein G9A89_020493 [Geosiphon pyriformis]
MPEEQDFHYTAPLEGRAAAQQQNPFYTPTTIPPARIAENANLLDIFPFEFKANESSFLLSNAAANEQKAITAMYTEAKVERKAIRLILDSGSTGSIITYQLMQQLKRNVDQPAQIVIITADGMKKTPIGEINNFPFTLDGIIIPVKILVMNNNTPCLTYGDMLPEECNWIDVAIKGGVCDQICQYALSISEKVKRGTPFNAAYNSALNKLYYYSHNAEMIFDLAMALINGATKENVHQMKETEYIEYTIELTGFDYEDEQMNIRLCEECIMSCDEQWCPEYYALSIPLPSKSDENEIKFGEFEATEEIETTPIYLIKNQPALQFKYFNNNGQGIKPEKAHEINAGYDLRYPNKNTLVFKPKSLTKINLKIALEILPGAMVQITSWSSLASKGINVKGGIIDARYTGDITVMLQNETDKPFKIEHTEKIAQAIYLLLINILGLQLINQKEQLGKNDRGIQGFGSTGRFTVSVNIALNTQNESHQILRLPQTITILLFGEHLEIYTCPKPTTTQQISSIILDYYLEITDSI